RGSEQRGPVRHPGDVQRVVGGQGQTDVQPEPADHRRGPEPDRVLDLLLGGGGVHRGSRSASAIQDPWKPDGTPRGSCTAATGGPATSVASSTSSCDALPSRRVVMDSSQPSSSARSGAPDGTNTASPATVSVPRPCSVRVPWAASNLTIPARPRESDTA